MRRVPTRPIREAAQAQPEPPRTLSGSGVTERTIHTHRGGMLVLDIDDLERLFAARQPQGYFIAELLAEQRLGDG